MIRINRFLRHQDGVNTLLTDRSEVGNFYIPDRETSSVGHPALGEFTPEHVHHNFRHSDAYIKSKQRRGKEAAKLGEFGGAFSNKEMW